MHELGIAVKIVDTATRRAGEARVVAITVEVGVLTAVLPDALSFCFDLATAGTRAEGASLLIRQPPARARCSACGGEVLLDKPLGECRCGGIDLEWLTGDELRIVEMELQPCAEPADAQT